MSNKSNIKPLVIRTNMGDTFLDYTEIVRIMADGDQIVIYNKKGEKLISSVNFSNLKEVLPEKIFFKSHRSHIVNLAYISNFNSKTGKLIVDGDEVPISRNSQQKFMELLTAHDDIKYINNKPRKKKMIQTKQ